MILFDFPEEKSTLFRLYLPPDLLEQVKAQQHRRHKIQFNLTGCSVCPRRQVPNK